MVIEVGKFYRTRDGRKAVVYSFYGEKGTEDEIHGAIRAIDNDVWLPRCWSIGGNFMKKCESDCDLVAEWVEPKPKLLGYVTNYGKVRLFPEGFECSPQLSEQLTRCSWLDQP